MFGLYCYVVGADIRLAGNLPILGATRRQAVGGPQGNEKPVQRSMLWQGTQPLRGFPLPLRKA